MSGGAGLRKRGHEEKAIRPGREPAPCTPSPLDKLHQPGRLEGRQVALYGPDANSEGRGQGVHPRPAEAVLVACVVGQGAVRADQVRRGAGAPEQDHLRDAGERAPRQELCLLAVPRRVRSGDPW